MRYNLLPCSLKHNIPMTRAYTQNAEFLKLYNQDYVQTFSASPTVFKHPHATFLIIIVRAGAHVPSVQTFLERHRSYRESHPHPCGPCTPVP